MQRAVSLRQTWQWPETQRHWLLQAAGACVCAEPLISIAPVEKHVKKYIDINIHF